MPIQTTVLRSEVLMGDVLFLKVDVKRIIDEATIEKFGNELFDSVSRGYTKILVSFDGVEYLPSLALGKMLVLQKICSQSAIKLRLCDFIPEVYRVFRMTKLNQLFDIRPSKGLALADWS